VTGVKNSDRGSPPRSGGGGGKRFARAFRITTASLIAAAALVVVLAPSTFADYADGGRTEQAMTLPDAVKVWRQEAWQRDDFLAQVRLGDLYSASQSIAPGESKNAAFGDPVEAYVWYFLALRPGRDYRADDNMSAADSVNNVRNAALNNAEQIYNSLTFEQRLDARARILYVLSSRGAEGFLTLGRIHASGWQDTSYGGSSSSTQPKVRLCMRSSWDHWWSGWLWWIWSSLTSRPYPHPPVWKWVDNNPDNWERRLPDYQCFGAEIPPPPEDPYSNSVSMPLTTTPASSSANNSGTPALIVPPAQSGNSSAAVPTINTGNSSYGSSDSYTSSSSSSASYGSGSGYGSYGSYGTYGSGYYGRSVSSVFVTNDAEALTYFLIAQSLGHPLAGPYVATERGAIRYYSADAGRIIADAEKRARFWNAPYEYYPGTTAKGELHSDESLPSFEQRMALRRVREIPLASIVEALDFRGYRVHPKLCGPPPVCLNRAVTQFQTALNWEPTGWLNPIQTVRLIQMAAVDGDAIAQDRLGIMYAKGIGVPQNFVKAEKWFIKAANQRYPDALFNLSVLYRVGPNGVEPDEHKSNSFRAQADAAGYAQARCELLDLLKLADGRPEGAKR
jgi:TPR repeat protein